MKKNLSRVLALALVLASLLSLTVGAFADGTTVVIPNKISRLEAQLPEREAQPTVRTKTKNGEIMVRVNGDPDTVYANWLGYGEEPEEVELENGLGYVELEGHKYQLGTKWSNKVVRSYFAYDPEAKGWVPVKYKGTVKVGLTEMKLIETEIGDAGINDMTYKKPWVWVYDYINTDTAKEGKEVSDPGEDYADLEVLAAGLPKQPKKAGANSNTNGITEATAYMSDNIDIKDGKYHNTYKNDSLYDANDKLIAYNSDAYNELDKKYDAKGNQIANAEKRGWVFMVPYYQFYEQNTGKDSSGAPNHAWIVEKGPWTATYTRAGKMVIVEKDEENTDYFKTGLAGSKGHVIWNMRKTDGGTKWYVAAVTEEYAEGDIAKAEAVYNVNGQLVRYFLTYRTAEDETYKIKYTTDNKPANGWYTGVDFDGNKITATANSLKTWRDDKTGKLTNQVELDWGLTALKDWTNPPRLAK